MSPIREKAKKFLDDHPEDRGLKDLELYRWPSIDGVRCPLCNGWRLYKEQRKGKPGYYRCPTLHQIDARTHARPYVFSVRTDTILEHSRVPLSKWLYCLGNVPPSIDNQRGMCAAELARLIDVTRRAATLMLELLRMMDHYFWFGVKPATLKSSHPATRAMEKFYAQPERNEFLMRYREVMLGPDIVLAKTWPTAISAE